MTTHDLSPAFVVVDYVSPYAAHKMTIPTRAWTAGGAHGFGTYEAWDTSTVEADDMINAFIDDLAKLFDGGVRFPQVTIFTKADAVSPAIPRALVVPTTTVGIDGTPGWTVAVQFDFTFFDTAFNAAKLVLLDAASNNNFARRISSTLSADEAE